MYGKADCSTAAATWFLTLVGLFAFVVGALTVFYASRALNIEIVSRLGQSACSRHDEFDHPADKRIFLTDAGELLEDIPIGLDEAQIELHYTPWHSAFVNLGRTALAGVQVSMHATGIADPQWYLRNPVDIGNVRCEHEVHLTIYVAKTLGKCEIAWSGARERGRAIEFYAEKPFGRVVDLPFTFHFDPAQMSLSEAQSTRRERSPRPSYIERIRVMPRRSQSRAAPNGASPVIESDDEG
jgi:hypothetical protein